MGIFDAIKNAIFGKAEAAPAAPSASGGAAAPTSASPSPAGAAPSQPVDVEKVLSDISAKKGGPKLNYKTSIVDLMKLLDLDPSLANRKELATELGYSGAKDGSAEMNIWLHKAVMKALADNGGVVPASFMD